MDYDSIIKGLPAVLCAAFVAVLFIQSGLDKAFDWGGNLGFLKEHFAKTFLSPMVPLMLATITLMEIATGVLAAVGVVYFFLTGSLVLAFYSSVLGAASILGLFFGQRVAKDYPGAAVLVPYFILLILMMVLSSPRFLRVF